MYLILTALYGAGEPKAIPWSVIAPLKAAADGWCHMDIQKGDVVAWPTNLGWMMGPWLVYASLLNGASMALYNGSPLGSGFAKFVQVSLLLIYVLLLTIELHIDHSSVVFTAFSKMKTIQTLGHTVLQNSNLSQMHFQKTYFLPK